MNLNVIKPLGLHVTGVIRFAAEGKGTPQMRMLDHFEVLGRSYQDVEGAEAPALKPHPIASQLVAAAAPEPAGAEAKLRAIPVKLVFEKPENSLSARYEAFDTQLNRLVCVGDGTACSRAEVSTGTVAEKACAGPDACEYANTEGVNCQLRVRLAVQIDGQDDPLSVFEFQSGGIHTYRNFAAKLAAIKALTGRLRGVPLTIRSYERGSAAHGYQSFHVADLVLRDPARIASIAQAPAAESGLNFDALEQAVETMREASPFALSDEAEDGIVFLQPPTDRRVRRPAPGKDGAAPASIAAVVSAARALALNAAGPATASQQEPAAAAALPPVQPAEVGTRTSPPAAGPAASVIELPRRTEPAPGPESPAPRRGRASGPAKMGDSQELPPTPL